MGVGLEAGRTISQTGIAIQTFGPVRSLAVDRFVPFATLASTEAAYF